MNDHHLDDLIIDDPLPNINSSKTTLAIIALAIVILIITLILWVLLSDPSSQDTSRSVQQQTKPLSPDLMPLDKSDKQLSKKQQRPKPAQQIKVQISKPKPKPKPKPVLQKPIIKPAQDTDKPAIITSKPTINNTSKSKNIKLINTVKKTIYYIQVGAFKKNPNPKFIKKLKDNGFTFITKSRNGIRRVRVGPYSGYQEAKSALPDIKTKIGVDGLIVKY